MTREELEQIKARAEAATPGPWYPMATDDRYAMNARYVSTIEGEWPKHDQQIGMDGSREAQTVAITLLQAPRYVDIHDEKWDENTEFIANARTDVPALVAEVERLRALLAIVVRHYQNRISSFEPNWVSQIQERIDEILESEKPDKPNQISHI